MGIDNLADPRAELKAMRRAANVQGTSSPAGNTSVSEGAFEIRSAEGLIVSGSAKVTGTVSVTGTETVSGTLSVTGTSNLTGPSNLTGTTKLTGDTTQQGPFHIQGATDITGALTVNGLTTLLKTLTVGAGGKIVVGNMVLDPAVGGSGAVGGISAPAAILLDAPTTVANHGLQVNGALAAQADVLFPGLSTTTNAANTYIDPAFGRISRVTSASRFKLDVQPADLPEALLGVQVKDWIDKVQHDAGNDGPRVPGVIAEEVESAGGTSFVTYNNDGEIDGVAYDRLALARTQILATRLEQALARIEELERRLAG